MFAFYRKNSILSSVEHEHCFITSGPGLDQTKRIFVTPKTLKCFLIFMYTVREIILETERIFFLLITKYIKIIIARVTVRPLSKTDYRGIVTAAS